MGSLANWFESEVLRWRTGAAIVWTCILMTPLAFLVSILYNFNLMQILFFFISAWSIAQFALVQLVMYILLCIQAILINRNFHVQYKIEITRMQTVWRWLSLKGVTSVAVPMMFGGLIVYCCLQLVYIQSSNAAKGEGWIPSEAAMFLILHGCFVGMFHSFLTAQKEEYHLKFFCIWQLKYLTVKGQLLSLIYDTFSMVVKMVVLFFILYYFAANMFRAVFHSTFHSRYNSSTPEVTLSNVMELLSLTRLWTAWLTGSFVLVLLRLSLLLCTVYHSEPYQFPIDTEYKEKEGKCLHDALTCKESLKVQYLASMDLLRLSLYSPARRLKLFSITQFGGHPVNWTRVFSVVRDDLTALLNQIREYNDHSISAPLAIPLDRLTDLHYRGVADTQNKLKSPHGQPRAPVAKPSIRQRIVQFIIQWFRGKMMDSRIARYLTAIHPESVCLLIFTDMQKYIWLIEALSHLTRASSEEDKYGVVQKSLIEIISLYINLLEAIDKHLRLCPIGLRKVHAGTSNTLNPIFALRSALKESLYRIVVTFKHHLAVLAFSDDQRRRLAAFIEFRE